MSAIHRFRRGLLLLAAWLPAGLFIALRDYLTTVSAPASAAWAFWWFIVGLLPFCYCFVTFRQLEAEQSLAGRKLLHAEAASAVTAERLFSTSQALMENAFRLSSIIDNTQDGLLLYDDTGRIFFMSPQAQRLFGLGPREYLQLNIRTLLTDSREAGIIPTGVTPDEISPAAPRELTALHRDGSRFPVEACISRTELEPDQVGYIAMIRDLSQLRRREVEFRQFRQAVEQSPVSVVITNLSGQIEYVNPKFTEVTGYNPDEVVGKNPRLLNSGKTPRETYTSMWATLQDGQTWTGDFINKKKNGDLYYEAASISPVRDLQGKPLFYVAVKEDVTQKRLAEEALRESQRFIRSTLDSLVDQVAIFDAAGELIDANASWQRYHSNSQDAHSRSLDACLTTAFRDPTSREAALHAVQDIIQRKRDRFAGEGMMGTPPRWYRLELSPFQGDGPMRLILTLHDIETQQQAMRALMKARDEAESASRAKSSFLATMSHELRTPLNSILGFADLLQGSFHGELNPKQRSYVQTIATAGRHLLDLINDLLDMARIEAGTISLSRHHISLKEIIDDLVQFVQPSIQEKNLLVSITIDKNADQSFSDPARTKQIILNLLSNAIKFTPVNGSIAIETRASGTNQVTVTVSDTGIGIESEDQRKVFTNFFQSRVAQKGQFGGTGIGLALCKRLVELQGGHIGFESHPGHGSHFWFTLPRLAPPSGPTESDISAQRVGYFPGAHVLLVSADDQTLESVQELLHLSGCRIDVARDIPQMFDLAIGHPPNLIILDLALAGSEAESAAATLRSQALTAGIPLIGVGRKVENAQGERLLKAGFNSLFDLPLPIVAFSALLQERLAENERKME